MVTSYRFKDEVKEIDLLLIRLKTPENVGSCYRLAMQYGINKIYNYKSREVGRTDVSNTCKHIPIEYIESLDFLKEYEFPTLLLETGGEFLPHLKQTTSNIDRYLIAVCHEGNGASEEEKRLFDLILTIPAPNTVTHEKLVSYNVSHALAIGLYTLEYER